MTNKIYYLASCDTCRKIIKSLPNTDRLEFHDIRQNPITEKELEEMSKQYNQKLEDIKKRFTEDDLDFIKMGITKRKTVDFLVENTKK